MSKRIAWARGPWREWSLGALVLAALLAACGGGPGGTGTGRVAGQVRVGVGGGSGAGPQGTVLQPRAPRATSPVTGSSATAARGPGAAAIDLDTSFLPGELIRSEEHTSELQSRENLVCRLLLEKKKCRFWQ